MDLQVETHSFVCDDVLEFPDHFPGWDLDLLQISGGRFDFNQFRVLLPGLTVGTSDFSRSFEMLAKNREDVICFALILHSEKPLQFHGVEISKPHLILLHPETEHALFFSGRTRVLDLQISLSTLRRLGWKKNPDNVYELSASEMETFYNWCSNMKNLDGKTVSLASLLRIRNQTLYLLAKLMGENTALKNNDTTAHAQNSDTLNTVKRARSALRALPFDASLRIPEIADELHMSDRQLYREFKSSLGIGPSRYFELIRLHALRGFLKHPDGATTPVSDAAKQFGFSNAGRMALRYNELFFEPPSQTARRTRRLTPNSEY
ncbi:helix-turn-helix domain-containing protein [Roseibium sp.]|uniref:AraC family transcriptional regulator n=1 Tax=Roseibium sp. TaxID=1936156 RepID=UPI003D13F5C0